MCGKFSVLTASLCDDRDTRHLAADIVTGNGETAELDCGTTPGEAASEGKRMFPLQHCWITQSAMRPARTAG